MAGGSYEGQEGTFGLWKKQGRRIGVCATARKAEISLPATNYGVKPKSVSHMKPPFLSSDK